MQRMTEAVSLEDVYNELKKIERKMVTKEEMNKFVDTLEVLSNEDTMSQIRQSERDIASGKFKEVNSVSDI